MHDIEERTKVESTARKMRKDADRLELAELLGEQEIKDEAVATAEDFAIRASRDEGLDF